MRSILLGLMLVVAVSAPMSAEWQVKPFLGGTFGGSTTFVDLEHAAGDLHLAFGASGMLLGEVFGVEGDVGHTPSFFGSGGQLVTDSGATTVTANLVVALPRRMARYTLRPYFAAGGGLMRVTENDPLNVLTVSSTLPAMDVGGGVTGFFTDRIGVSWGLRYFRSVGDRTRQSGVTIGAEQLSLWRADMALVIRY